MDLGPAQEPVMENLNVPTEVTWLEPMPDPADIAVEHERSGSRSSPHSSTCPHGSAPS